MELVRQARPFNVSKQSTVPPVQCGGSVHTGKNTCLFMSMGKGILSTDTRTRHLGASLSKKDALLFVCVILLTEDPSVATDTKRRP